MPAELDLRDYAGADPTGVNDSTTAAKTAIADAIATGKPLRISRGDWLITDSLLPGTHTEKLTIYGDGMRSSRIVNRCLNKTLFNVGNTDFFELRDMTIEGNNVPDFDEDEDELNVGLGNGHAIALTSPTSPIGSGTFRPSYVRLSRLKISHHLGTDDAFGGADMPACAIYNAGSLSLLVDHVYMGYCMFGCYNLETAQTEFRSCVWDHNRLAAIVNEKCENFRVVHPDIVGDHGAGAKATLTGTLGKVRVNAAGAQNSGFSAKCGAVVDFFGVGSEYLGGKYKNHVYAGLALYSPHKPLVLGAYIRQEVQDTCGIFNAFGARIVANTFALANRENSTDPQITNRIGVWCVMQGGYASFGTIEGNHFVGGGSGAYGTAIYIDGSSEGGFGQTGVIQGNTLGDGSGVSTASTWDYFIRITGNARSVAVRDNHAVVGLNLTVTVGFSYSGITGRLDEGLIDDANSYLVAGGALTTAKTLPADYTGLQHDGKYNVKALTVGGVQVVGAQGAAVANAGGGTTVDTEARAAINTLLARLRAHGLIAS